MGIDFPQYLSLLHDGVELLHPDTVFLVTCWNDLPAQAVKYVRHVEELIGAPVALLSTSPERDDTIMVRDPFEG